MGQKRKAVVHNEQPTKKTKLVNKEVSTTAEIVNGSEAAIGSVVKNELHTKQVAINNTEVKQKLLKKKIKKPKVDSKKKTKKEMNAVKVSDEVAAKNTKWTNKTRVLVFCSRGISFQGRHLMKDVSRVMPHSKTDTKLERKESLFVINELCEMKNCSKCIFFESRKKMDLYMWLTNAPNGPSVKFLVENVHTMQDLKMTGNCLRGSRPLLSFDKGFDKEPHWKLLKEMFIQTFSTPHNHPKSQPFIDRVAQFSIAGGKIWCRNYEIADENGELIEIGPRLVLNPIRIFKGSFGGETLYKNSNYVSPNKIRGLMKREKKMQYLDRVSAKKSRADRHEKVTYPTSALDDVFDTNFE